MHGRRVSLNGGKCVKVFVCASEIIYVRACDSVFLGIDEFNVRGIFLYEYTFFVKILMTSYLSIALSHKYVQNGRKSYFIFT